VYSFAKKLPHRLEDLFSILTITYTNFNRPDIEPQYFQVRSHMVLNALHWLKSNNAFYEDIEISLENEQLLPSDKCVYNDIISITVTSNDVNSQSMDTDEDLEGVEDANCQV